MIARMITLDECVREYAIRSVYMTLVIEMREGVQMENPLTVI